MTQKELREQLRRYLLAHNSTHYMPDKKQWTCHVTLGYDLYEIGQTEEEAIKRLIHTIVGSKHRTSIFISLILPS